MVRHFTLLHGTEVVYSFRLRLGAPLFIYASDLHTPVKITEQVTTGHLYHKMISAEIE